MPTQLEKAQHKRGALTMEEAQRMLTRAARAVGRVHGVGLAVELQSDGLIFVDDVGEHVVDDFAPDGPLIVPCASAEEIKDGTFLKLFAARSFYAALVLKFSEIAESEQAG